MSLIGLAPEINKKLSVNILLKKFNVNIVRVPTIWVKWNDQIFMQNSHLRRKTENSHNNNLINENEFNIKVLYMCLLNDSGLVIASVFLQYSSVMGRRPQDCTHHCLFILCRLIVPFKRRFKKISL